MIKRYFCGICILVAFCACNNNKGNTESVDAQSTDSMNMSADTSVTAEVEAEEADPPKTVDKLFDDFIFNFSSSKRFQMKRIQFPLPCSTNGRVIQKQRNTWQYQRIFRNEDFYYVLYDNERQMKIEKDTSVSSVSISWLSLADKKIQRYRFSKVNGLWMLIGIEKRTLGPNDNSDFLSFYHQFVNDSVYQRSHVANPLRFVTADPDNEFATIEGTLDVDQWFLFKPELSGNKLTCIDYGQHYTSKSHKVLEKKGFSNGIVNIFTFRRQEEEWTLVSYEN